MNKLVFLGTGAGDVSMLSQKVRTSALYFEFDGLKFILDPGPGTIVNANQNKINLLELNGLIITHPHPDHYADANCLIDALRKQGTFLIAGKKCLFESENYFPCINKFQQTIPDKVFGVEHEDKVTIGRLSFKAIKNNHLDCGLGIKMIGSRKIGYVGDGTLKGLEKFYQDMDMLIFNVLVPYGKSTMFGIHTSVNEIIEFLKDTKPKRAIIQHFSKEMIESGIDNQAKVIEEKSGFITIAAKDGMVVNL